MEPERKHDIYVAVNERDSEALYRLARLEKKEGNDEEADALLKVARTIDKDDWAYDSAINN